MKILITGATGLIGSELISLLLDNSISVHYLTTSRSKIKNDPNCQGFFWDPKNGILDKNSLIGVNAIIHLAGANIAKRWTSIYKSEILQSRVLASNTLFNAVKENPNNIKQIVSASGTAIYPDREDYAYSEENTVVEDNFLSNVVVEWEQSVDQFRLLDIKVCKLRTGVVFSKKGGALQEMIKPIRFGCGAPFGNGKQVTSWIHIDDLVAMYLFAVKNSWDGVYNAVAPYAVSNQNLIRLIAQKLRRPLWLPAIPKLFMKAILGEMHELLFNNKKISAQKAINAGFQFRFPTAEKAVKDLVK